MVGILATIEYQEHHVRLEEGDTLVIYSDGVTEAENQRRDEFEVEGLVQSVIANRRLPAEKIIEEVNRAVAEFTAGAPQSDDITLVVARRVGG